VTNSSTRTVKFGTCALIVTMVLLLVGCNLGQSGSGGLQGEAGGGNAGEGGGVITSGNGNQAGSPNTQTTYAINVPFVANSGAQSADWQLVPQSIQTNDENLNLRIEAVFPEIEGASNEAITLFNQEVEQRVTREIQVGDELGGAPVPDPGGFVLVGYQATSAQGWSGFDPYTISDTGPQTYDVDQVLLESGHQVLSILFEVVTYFGGAHPGMHHQAINFDFSSGRFLGLEDLFRPDVDYLSVIADYSIQELKKNQEILFEDFEQYASPEPENYSVWSLTPQGLLIIFEEYQVAPYAAGPQSVLVPYSALEGVLDPDGPVG
jgi:hypothetical protein